MRNFIFSFRGALLLSHIIAISLGIYWGVMLDSRIVIKSEFFILIMGFITAKRGNANIKKIEDASEAFGGTLPDVFRKGVRFGNILTFAVGTMLLILMVKQLILISEHEETIKNLSEDIVKQINQVRYSTSLIVWLFVYDILFLLLYFEPKTKKFFN